MKTQKGELNLPRGFLNFLSTPLSLRFNGFRPFAHIPFRSLKRIFDHSKVRFTAHPKLALWAQTLDLLPIRFTKNGWARFFNVRSRESRQQPVPK
jgi:hypothetical protein